MSRIFKVFIVMLALGFYLMGEAHVFAADELELKPYQLYKNEDFHCQMSPPEGWLIVTPQTGELITLLKKSPFTYNGLPIMLGINIKGKFLNSTVKSYNEISNDKLQNIISNCLPDLEKNGKTEGTIKDIGAHKVIWFEVLENKMIMDNNVKTFYINFMDNGYIWSLVISNVPTQYCDTMSKDIVSLIASFKTI
ncbi:MAG: hypothetical protein LLG02_00035 [Pelosinus sp.]|nr:hypothetical protein [Pelosinus sp.]